MIKKIIAILPLLMLNIGCELGDDCGPFPETAYRVTGITTDNVQLNNRGYRNASSIPDSTLLPFNEFALAVYPETERVSTNTFPVPSLFTGFSHPAYACSPPAPTPTENVSEITVFSNTDYQQQDSNTILYAGDTLNGIFQIVDFYSGNITGLATFLKISKQIPASDEGFFLVPLARPRQETTHRFTVHYRLEDGTLFTFEADPITLTP